MTRERDEFKVERAQRSQVKLRLALQGPSNAGKTATALLLARGMVAGLRARGKLPTHLDDCFIGLVDTENDSASLYDHIVPFDRVVLGAPYTVERYLGAVEALLRVGYPIIIVDQISHEWAGPGGILDRVARASGENDWAKWNGPSQDHDLFIETLLHLPAHLIATMRAKTAYVLEKKIGRDGRERNVPTRIGMAPKQREGTEYEFTTLLDLSVVHDSGGKNAVTCLKDRTGLFVGGDTIPRMGPEWGERLMDWVYSAKKEAPPDGEVSPVLRARALYEAAVRAIDVAPNIPDLQNVYAAQVKLLRAFSVEAGKDTMVPLLAQLEGAKDQRKVFLAGQDPAQRASDLTEADRARLAEPAAPGPPTALEKAREITERIGASRPGLFQEGSAQRAAAGGFSDMEDDLPWRDEPAGASTTGGT